LRSRSITHRVIFLEHTRLFKQSLSLPRIGELFRVASEHRPVLLKLIQGGAKLQAVHDKATELARLTKKVAQTIEREVLVRGQRETRH
jgi:hypothetical protein